MLLQVEASIQDARWNGSDSPVKHFLHEVVKISSFGIKPSQICIFGSVAGFAQRAVEERIYLI